MDVKFGVALALACFGVHANANDIAGVKLGMTIAQARSAFSVPAGMKTIPVKTDNMESGFAGWKGKKDYSSSIGQGPADEILVFKGKADTVWYVERVQRLTENEGYAKEVLIESLRKKFGKESYSNIDGFVSMMAWEYDQSGKQYLGNPFATPNPCKYSFELGNLSRDRYLPEPMGITGAVNEFTRSCKLATYANWVLGGNGLVNGLRLVMIDSGAIVRMLEGQKAQEDAENQKKLQQQLNKGIKPSL